jgi:hypothetical protein
VNRKSQLGKREAHSDSGFTKKAQGFSLGFSDRRKHLGRDSVLTAKALCLTNRLDA